MQGPDVKVTLDDFSENARVAIVGHLGATGAIEHRARAPGLYDVQNDEHARFVDEQLPAHRKNGYQRTDVAGNLNEQVAIVGEPGSQGLGIVGHAADENRVSVRVHAEGLDAENVVDQIDLDALQNMTRYLVVHPFRYADSELFEHHASKYQHGGESSLLDGAVGVVHDKLSDEERGRDVEGRAYELNGETDVQPCFIAFCIPQAEAQHTQGCSRARNDDRDHVPTVFIGPSGYVLAVFQQMAQVMRLPVETGIELVAFETHLDDSNLAQRATLQLELALLPECIAVHEHELLHEQQDGGDALLALPLVLGKLVLDPEPDAFHAFLGQC